MDPSPLVDEVVSLERRLLDPATRANPEVVGRLLHDDFTEVGASGTRWDKPSMVEFLARQPGALPEISQLVARAICDDAVLVTYVATQVDGSPASFRSSLWVSVEGEWRVLFHQGTAMASGVDG